MTSAVHAAFARAGELAGRGELAAAERIYLDLTRIPDAAREAFIRLAEIASARRSPGTAMRRLQRAAKLGADDGRLHHLYGVSALELGQRVEAVHAFDSACSREPDNAVYVSCLGNALRQVGDHDRATAAHARAVAMAPEHAELWSNYGLALRDAGDHTRSMQAFARAVALRPDYASLRHNLGNAKLRAASDDAGLRAAIDTLEDALALSPTAVGPRIDLATALRALGRHDDATGELETVLRQAPDHPDARFNLGLARLRDGDWARGWPLYEARRELSGFPVQRMDLPDWDGSPQPAGHLLLTSEQGLGDTVQFCRFAPLAALAHRGRVTLRVPARMVPLLSALPGVEVVDEHTEVDASEHLPLMSLPNVLGLRPIPLPSVEGYLHPAARRVDHWSNWLREQGTPGALRIGIAWQGNPNYAGDRHRSVPLSAFAPIAAIPGVELWVLQHGHGVEQIEASPKIALRRLPQDVDREGAFVDTAAIVAALDLVISSDTSVLHVAAATGQRVFVPTARRCDWRWGRPDDPETSPWYAHARLFRQRIDGDWASVFSRIATAVLELREELSCKYVSTSAQAS